MEFVTDRTESDVLLGNEKGVYSYSDLNRVEQAVQNISAMLPTLGFDLLVLQTKTDWGYPGSFSTEKWPVASQMQRYLNNIAAIKNTFGVSTKIPSSMARMTWANANNIERTLQTATLRATNTIASFRYSGEIYSGEV